MKTKINGFLTLLLALIVQFSFAQDRTISGSVSDDSGPLPGVSVLKKGTKIGTETDFDGNYSIKAKTGDILVFSFVGMATLEKTVANSNKINATLTNDNVLDEVVITGGGITKKEKAVGYAIQKVDADQVNNAKEPNLVNALQGKIAGVQIQGSPSALGGSSRITIRGSNSFLGNNTPLFVVDGVPIFEQNLASDDQQRGFGNGAFDYGNQTSDIDPSNIESMSVLKGAAATAIYGSRGANGVILITTKKGRNAKGIGVSFNSSITLDQVDNLIPIQRSYGGGAINPSTASGFDEFTQDGVRYLAPIYKKDGSWGPKFDPNVLVRHWDSWDPNSSNYKEVRPWVAPETTYDDFFNTGVTLTNSIAISGGNEKGLIRLGYTNLDQEGTTPGGHLERNTINLNSSYKFTDKLKAGFVVNYVRTDAENRNSTGYDNANPMQAFTQWWQSQLDVSRLRKNTTSSTGTQNTWNFKGPEIDPTSGQLLGFNYNPEFFDNPFWVRENYLQEDTRNRVFGNANLAYKLTDNLSITTQFSTDTYQFSIREGIPQGSANGARYEEAERRFQETNIEARLNYNTQINDNLTLSAVLGANRMRQFIKRTTVESDGGLVIDNFFNIANSKDPALSETEENQKGINSIFATASLGWKDMLFLDLTARNDWSSTLPQENNDYFYPAASLSFVPSELDFISNSDVIDFLKLRASIAQAGNDADPYRLIDTYDPINPNFNGSPLYETPLSKNNPSLVNELTTEFEFGLDIRMFNNRVNLDVAYFDRSTVDQIFNVTVPAATGFTSRILNAGEMRNYGLEINLSTTPIKTEDFSWDVNINLTSLNNEVVSISKGKDGAPIVNNIPIATTWAAEIRLEEGLPYMAIFGQNYVFDDNGNRVVDSNGYYKFTDEREYLGSAVADWTGGFNTSFQYKNLTLSALFDFQIGGSIHSTSLQWSRYSGMHPETVSFNGESDIRANGLLLPGVKEDGTPNDIRITNPQEYFTSTFRVAAPNFYDASFLKFREIRLGYKFPKSILDKTPFTDLNLGVFGRNLAILHSDIPYLDPQIVTGSGNIQGLENAQIPSTRSFGFNLSMKF